MSRDEELTDEQRRQLRQRRSDEFDRWNNIGLGVCFYGFGVWLMAGLLSLFLDWSNAALIAVSWPAGFVTLWLYFVVPRAIRAWWRNLWSRGGRES